MTPSDLLKHYRNDPRIAEWLRTWSALKPGESVGLHGAAGSLKSVAAACASEQSDAPLVVVRLDKEDAAYFFNDVEKLLPAGRAVFYPDSYRRPYAFEETANANVVLRAEVLNRLGRSAQGLVVVTYPEALFEQVVSHKTLQGQTFSIAVGDALGLDFLNETLFELHFERTDFVTEPGQFAVRGGIVDVFSYALDRPYRIEFLGDQVESIRIFDVETQWSEGETDRMDVVPNIENKSVLETREAFWDFVPDATRWWIESDEVVSGKLDRFYAKAEEAFADLTGPIQRSEPHKLFVSGAQWEKALESRSWAVDGEGNAHTVRMETLPSPSFGKNFNLLADTLENHRRLGRKVVLMAHAQSQIDRLRTLFQDMGRLVEFDPILGALHSGWEDLVGGHIVYTDHEIFERYQRFRLKNGFDKAHAITLQELQSLQMGDFVTHLDHGVGKFGGLQKIDVGGAVQEAIKLIYRDNDVLYVSIHSLHKIAKFNAKDGTAPALHKLGSGHWQALKAKAKKRVKEMAYDLIQLYARRKEAKGHAFAPDSYLQHELEASFAYEDTPDQVKATADVKGDMERVRPMDRLVCGDVGFGKTEIAIRAAFKAATDGKQVAVLVPTTLLAFQHHKTFRKRLSNFPVRVDYLNRTRSAKETKAILQDLADGKIDILIGTHKLVGKDVHFKDLGLLIIDEEQKFGVNVKDKLKTLRVHLDTLTLTATPIPRTLQFSLLSARDLSVMTTPPPNRQPIETHVMGFSEDVVRDAIQYEMSRGGQVFFIHNRIENIQEVAGMIQRLVPDAKVGIAHGQLEGHKLETLMLSFMEAEFDVLVSTTLIESGLDVPNANTIVINQAHRFGLSDLHQMRGRVGRSNRKAFCYLLAPPLSSLPDESRKRLQALEQFSDLGSGFKIALRDLEIRGSGDLLGADQSGFINDLGFDTYQKILAEAVAELKKTDFKDLFTDVRGGWNPQEADCLIDTDLEVLLPDSYVNFVEERLKLYQALDALSTPEELAQFQAGLVDRFGPLPPAAVRLLQAVRVKWLGTKIGLEKLVIKQGKAVGYFPADAQSDYYQSPAFHAVLNALQTHPLRFRMKQKNERLTLLSEPVPHLEAALEMLHLLLPTPEPHLVP